MGAARKRVDRMSYKTQLIAGASIAAVGLLATGGAAYALWSAQDTVSGGKIAAGDLNLSYGEGTWSQVTPDVAVPAGGTLAGGTDGFHSMPGDIVEIRVPLTTVLRGDNLNARMNVEMGSGAEQSIADGTLAATYVVENAASEPASEEAELGEPVSVAGLAGSNAGVTANWTVVVTIHVLGDYRWTDKEPLHDLDAWSVDGINVTLEQIRSGDGYTDGEG